MLIIIFIFMKIENYTNQYIKPGQYFEFNKNINQN